ncbi:MAG: LytTR family transcriptional regulator [Clostridiales bacterium]|nr:LytTR family transcriptional regulator [Clostridiales bacterium]
MSILKFSRSQEAAQQMLVLFLRKGIFRIPVDSIRCLQKEGRKLWIVYDGGRVSHYGKLDEVEAALPEYFCRCHHSTVVNLRRVVRLEGNRFHLETGEVVAISQRRGAQVRRAYLRFLEEI